MRGEEELACDVLVLGGGLAAVCAAVQAARLGCDVILLEKDPVLGGASSPMLGIHPSGAHSFHPYAAETGIIGEIEEEAAWRRAKIRTAGQHHNIAQQWDTLLKEFLDGAGVRVLRQTYARQPVVEGRRITAVLAEDTARFRSLRIGVRGQVVEASGDGHIAASAGATFRQGREARAEFEERSAPETADSVTLGASVTALVRKTSRPVTFAPPPGTPPFEPGYGFAATALGTERCLHAHSAWNPDEEFCFLTHTETGGQRDVIADDPEIYEELLRQLYSAWNHIKNEAHAREASHWELVWVSPKAGRRESRRFAGDLWVTQADIENGTAFPDAVGYGGYAVDIHDPAGAEDKQVEVVYYSIPPLWSIPYRALYSRDLENLFLAGRLAGFTHLGLGSYRMQKTLAQGGQAVGLAAALCKQYGCTPRALYQERLAELQQRLLKEDATILNLRGADPANLAARASASATSEQRHGVLHATDWLPLDRPRGVQLWDWAPSLRQAQLLLLNPGDEPRTCKAALMHYRPAQPYKESHSRVGFAYERVTNRMEWGDDNLLAHWETVAELKLEVPGRFAGWVEAPFNQELSPKTPTSDEERWMVLVEPAPGLSWGRDLQRYDFVRRAWLDPGSGQYATDGDSHCFRIDPAPPYGEAANVLNGWRRRFATNPVNMWISAFGEPLPQSLTLEWPEPQTFNTVHLVFDTLMRTFKEMPFNRDEEVAPVTVEAYDLEVFDGSGWRLLASETDNYRRRRVHVFPTVCGDRLRLTVRGVWGEGGPARVYEVRVYHEPPSPDTV